MLAMTMVIWARLPADRQATSAGASINSNVDVSTSADKRIPHPPPHPGEVRSLSIKQLGNFDYAPDGGTIPSDVRALNGLTVRLQGYMIPQLQTESVSRFLLVPSLFNCCFGKPPT